MQWYWKFAVIIAVTTVITVTLSVWETRRVSRKQQTNNITDDTTTLESFLAKSETEGHNEIRVQDEGCPK